MKIIDLHFHDLRHEATSRLFEAGFLIQQVALVTGHKDWKMLKRYTNLRPEQIYEIAKEKAKAAATPTSSQARGAVGTTFAVNIQLMANWGRQS